MVKFQVHAASDVLEFQHGAAPGRTGDRDMNGIRTKFRMPGEESIAASEQNGRVTVMHRLDVKNRRGRKVMKKDSAFNFGLDNRVVNFVGEICVRGEHDRTGIRVMGFR
ncbi:MAG: hypothetical protein JWQ87_1634 [Candidatus Sulfotelmatobacter sp.]|nr:hypothetical protein [Candidatus Sulfotelmatobacter sp.]